MKQYLLAHDLGTSGNKATLFDLEGRLVASSVFAYGLHTGSQNVAEQNAEDWWRAVCETTRSLSEKVGAEKIAAVSFSGQMMGCLCVDRKGDPLHPALIWADMRSTEQAAALSAGMDAEVFYGITGHRISASYSITKLMWIRDHLPEIYRQTYRMLNAKDYMIYRLTGRFVTEPSDASSTCLMDLRRQTWSEDLLKLSGLSGDKLPEIIRSVDIAGGVSAAAATQTGLLEGTPVVCGGGDGCCAAVGSGVIREGRANCCLGTSSWISLASREPLRDEAMTVFHFAHIVPGYILPCGTMQTGGGALSWAVQTLFAEAEGEEPRSKTLIYQAVNREAAQSPAGAGGLLFLPYLIGERAPRWNDKARGTFLGLTLNHGRGDLLRAVMEGVGYNFDRILSAFRQSGLQPDELLMIGGGARNRIWVEILSDILGLPISVPDCLEEATSMGAAITAGVGIGAFSDFEAADRFIKVASQVRPCPERQKQYEKPKRLFEEAYRALCPVFEKM